MRYIVFIIIVSLMVVTSQEEVKAIHKYDFIFGWSTGHVGIYTNISVST